LYLLLSYACTAVVSLSGPGGAVLRRFNSWTGQLVLETRLQTPRDGHLLDSGDFGDGTAIAFMGESQDIVALTSGRAVQRIEETGRVRWIWESAEKT
jgi:hypothetical protein